MTEQAAYEMDIRSALGQANHELLAKFDTFRTHFNSKSSNARIFSNLQNNVCLVRCEYDILEVTYKNIDPLYAAKHEYVKNKIIEAIIERFGDLVVESEHVISTGKLDIALLPPHNLIVLKYESKVIGIEIKSGN